MVSHCSKFEVEVQAFNNRSGGRETHDFRQNVDIGLAWARAFRLNLHSYQHPNRLWFTAYIVMLTVILLYSLLCCYTHCYTATLTVVLLYSLLYCYTHCYTVILTVRLLYSLLYCYTNCYTTILTVVLSCSCYTVLIVPLIDWLIDWLNNWLIKNRNLQLKLNCIQ